MSTSKLALGKLNVEKFEETMQFLREVIQVVTEMEVGKSGSWKPFQTGVIISTMSIMQLTNYLFDKEGFEFVLTSRFMQDCLENVFSVICSKNVIPNAVQFKNNLKLITTFLKKVQKSAKYTHPERIRSKKNSCEYLLKKK